MKTHRDLKRAEDLRRGTLVGFHENPQGFET